MTRITSAARSGERYPLNEELSVGRVPLGTPVVVVASAVRALSAAACGLGEGKKPHHR